MKDTTLQFSSFNGEHFPRIIFVVHDSYLNFAVELWLGSLQYKKLNHALLLSYKYHCVPLDGRIGNSYLHLFVDVNVARISDFFGWYIFSLAHWITKILRTLAVILNEHCWGRSSPINFTNDIFRRDAFIELILLLNFIIFVHVLKFQLNFINRKSQNHISVVKILLWVTWLMWTYRWNSTIIFRVHEYLFILLATLLLLVVPSYPRCFSDREYACKLQLTQLSLVVVDVSVAHQAGPAFLHCQWVIAFGFGLAVVEVFDNQLGLLESLLKVVQTFLEPVPVSFSLHSHLQIIDLSGNFLPHR